MAWQLYDDLLDLLPTGIKVTRVASSHWSAVATEDGGLGVAMTYSDGPRHPGVRADLVGKDLRDVAALVKSWDPRSAAIGTAALNSWLNRPSRLEGFDDAARDNRSTFSLHAPQLQGRRVATIGHFADIDAFHDQCDLIVLERSPRGRDLPDPACEYVLSDREHVYITGSALTNKTLPRLLELSAGARVVLVGPSVPFAPEVLAPRVAEIGGSVVIDASSCVEEVSTGGSNAEFRPFLQHFNISF